MAGALLYLVCLSGALAVFYEELERWEQPEVAESLAYDAASLEKAYNGLAAQGVTVTPTMYVALPTAGSPRTIISTEEQGWFVNADGSFGDLVGHDWTHLLIELHVYLHLPENIGLILVSALGAILCALILSGLFAHPRLFKDAFALRLGGSRHLEQADIHNRLSVWSAPFQLVIAVTGAWFGLASLVAWILGSVYFDGDSARVNASVFGDEPKLQQPLQPVAIGRTLLEMARIAPAAKPFYITIEKAGSPAQFLIVGAAVKDRLIYAEQFHFDSAGNYLGKVGFEEGPAGRQAAFSTYRLHFGHFGGYAVKLLYGLLGLAMAIVAATGCNVWLARRRKRDYLDNVWAGFVWGTPVALALSAIAQVLLGIPAKTIFWVVIIAAMGLAQSLDDEQMAKHQLQVAAAVALVGLLLGYALKFGAHAFTTVPVLVNGGLLLAAALLLWAGLPQYGRRWNQD